MERESERERERESALALAGDLYYNCRTTGRPAGRTAVPFRRRSVNFLTDFQADIEIDRFSSKVFIKLF